MPMSQQQHQEEEVEDEEEEKGEKIYFKSEPRFVCVWFSVATKSEQKICTYTHISRRPHIWILSCSSSLNSFDPIFWYVNMKFVRIRPI